MTMKSVVRLRWKLVRKSSSEPTLRPELTSVVAEVALPEYLGRPAAQKRDVRGGVVSLVKGAQARLHVRALYLNDQWEEFHEHRVEREQARLYTRPAA